MSQFWRPAQAAAIAFGAVLTRALLAFTYTPIVGDVSHTAKYTHNIVLLAVVATAGLVALRRTSSTAQT